MAYPLTWFSRGVPELAESSFNEPGAKKQSSINLDELRLIEGGPWTTAALPAKSLRDHLVDDIFHLRVWSRKPGWANPATGKL